MNRGMRIFVITFSMMFFIAGCVGPSPSQTSSDPGDSPSEIPEQTSAVIVVTDPTAEGPMLPEVDLRKGQVAYIINGNVWYQNLETGESRQLTYDANASEDFLHVYTDINFSPGGRYLAYEYGRSDDGTLQTYIVDLATMQLVSQLPGEMIVGWRYQKDKLIVGHNSALCGDWMDPLVVNADVDFIASVVNPAKGTISELVTLHNGYRLPTRVFGSDNRMEFMPCPCDAYECYWAREVFSSTGEQLSYEQEITSAYSSDGRYKIPIFYSIHQPETTPLVVEDLQAGTKTGIFLEEGKYPTTADWSPANDWIVIWLGDTAEMNHRSRAMVIRPDGSEAREISPHPGDTVGWFPDGRLILMSMNEDQLVLYDCDTGQTETLATLDSGGSFSSFQWSKLP